MAKLLRSNLYCWAELTGFVPILLLGFIILSHAKATQTDVAWHIGGEGLFDSTNKAYPITDGCVTVNLGQEDVFCPTGLGHLASGRPTVEEIVFIFDTAQSGTCWLHISWNPGGSGNEQFEVLCNGLSAGKSNEVDGQQKPYLQTNEQFEVNLKQGQNSIKLQYIRGDGLRFKDIIMCTSKDLSSLPLSLKPNLKYPTLKAYEKAIENPGVMLDSTYVRLFAPKTRAKEARIIFEYLVKACDQLYQLVGAHTEYKIVVYHFPQDHPDGWGGTSNCTIWYSEKNLDLNYDTEWKQYGVPHVCGYIEEMAHNFVNATKAQFGWEMIGWSIGTEVTAKVADNPIWAKNIRETRNKQLHTFNRYVELDYTFSKDIAPNLCDRIHAHILFLCENKYGPNFWSDFFREIRKEHQHLIEAAALSDADEVRNKRYQITIECFDRLEGLDFKDMLKEFQISLTTDVKSLHPTKPGWNRKFIH